MREIKEAVGISSEGVVYILHKKLGLKKLCARWGLHLFNPEQNPIRARTSADGSQVFQANSADFKRRFVTTDETWVDHYTPETKIRSKKKWTGPGGLAPKKPKTIQSAGKVMASVFWYAKAISLIEYL